jgi:hypothetical protein
MAVNNVFHTEMVSFLKKYNRKTNAPKTAENTITLPSQGVSGKFLFFFFSKKIYIF